MKLLLDQALPCTAAALLREGGLDAVHVGEIGHATSDDAEILRQGQEDNRVIVTLDADFHALLALTGASSPSVVRIRVEGLRAEAASKLIQTVVTRCGEELEDGAVVTVQLGRIRIRRLPLAIQHSQGEP